MERIKNRKSKINNPSYAVSDSHTPFCATLQRLDGTQHPLQPALNDPVVVLLRRHHPRAADPVRSDGGATGNHPSKRPAGIPAIPLLPRDALAANLLLDDVQHADANTFAGDISNKSSLRGLRDQNGGLLFQPSLTADTPSTLYAQPINYVKNSSWDKTQALLVGGDFSQAVYAIRQDMTYKILDQAVISDGDGRIIYNLAQQDMVALRCVMRLGWQLPNPVTALNSDGTTRYPFAVLAPQAVSGGGE